MLKKLRGWYIFDEIYNKGKCKKKSNIINKGDKWKLKFFFFILKYLFLVYIFLWEDNRYVKQDMLKVCGCFDVFFYEVYLDKVISEKLYNGK